VRTTLDFWKQQYKVVVYLIFWEIVNATVCSLFFFGVLRVLVVNYLRSFGVRHISSVGTRSMPSFFAISEPYILSNKSIGDL